MSVSEQQSAAIDRSGAPLVEMNNIYKRFGGVLAVDDCRKTYEELKGKGVEFVSEPTERPYGVEAVMKDPFGNWFSLTQHFAG